MNTRNGSSPRRRGMIFLELLPTLVIAASAMSMAAVLIGHAWRADRRLIANDTADRTIEHLARQIRTDAAAAQSFAFVDDTLGISFDDGRIVWRAATDAITRTDSAGETVTWQTGTTSIVFEIRPGGFALLTTARADHSRELTMIVPTRWATEALK